MKTILQCIIIVFCLVGYPIRKASCQSSLSGPKGIQLKLVATESRIHVDDGPIVLRIELWNTSADNFPVGPMLGPFVNQPTYVRLEAWNEKGERVFLLDSMRGTGVSIFEKWWNLIPPGHYYGTEYQLNSTDSEFVKTPGNYRLVATYVSRGGVTTGNPESQIPAYNVWKGELASNAVWIHVLPNVEQQKQKHE